MYKVILKPVFTYSFLTRRIEISLSFNLIIKAGKRIMNLTTS
jgi:hypothetical protein